MKKSAENIMALLRGSTPVKLRSDDFRFSELSKFAQIASSTETTINLVVGDNLTFSEVQALTNIARDYIYVDIS